MATKTERESDQLTSTSWLQSSQIALLYTFAWNCINGKCVVQELFLQYSDTVAWVTGRASCL